MIRVCSRKEYPDLPFLRLLVKPKESSLNTKDLCPIRSHEHPGKCRNTQNTKEFPGREETKEFRNTKERLCLQLLSFLVFAYSASFFLLQLVLCYLAVRRCVCAPQRKISIASNKLHQQASKLPPQRKTGKLQMDLF